ncbi:MAG: YbhB/YbcL family Raf kinase inhibitor-like protein [Candidatus Levybacteria bacterium]|nr:YbhB/YbcL family Raf kinase inhibitor-like protein [Candidatus Levybacteria bacterium]
MKITSPAFEHNQKIPAKYSCDSQGVNPLLNFSDIPSNVKSLVLIVDDPDAPIGTFIHWVVFNIDPQVLEVQENSVPRGGIEGNSSLGKPGWVAPCPPTGTHRYFFKLYALDKMLNLDPGIDFETLQNAMSGHILDTAEVIGLYKRG